MEQSEPNDTDDWGTSRPTRVHSGNVGKVKDIRSVVGHAYKMVYPQESIWVLYMRFDKPDGEGDSVVRILLRACGEHSEECPCWTGDAVFFGGGGEHLNY